MEGPLCWVEAGTGVKLRQPLWGGGGDGAPRRLVVHNMSSLNKQSKQSVPESACSFQKRQRSKGATSRGRQTGRALKPL